MPIYGDGKQIRDWIYVDDHNLGVDLVLKKGMPAKTYNAGIKKTINWTLSNEPWWSNILDNRYQEWINKHYSTH